MKSHLGPFFIQAVLIHSLVLLGFAMSAHAQDGRHERSTGNAPTYAWTASNTLADGGENGSLTSAPTATPARELITPRTANKTSPGVTWSWLWLVLQLVPSPQMVFDTTDGTAVDFGLRWQITPLAVSWGVHKDLSPVRAFVVEPLVRHTGSFEIYFSPELLFQGQDFSESIMLRSGGRFYFPLYHKGEYLSTSVGAAHVWTQSAQSASFDAGFYVLAGSLGFVVSYTPWIDRAEWIGTFNVRVF